MITIYCSAKWVINTNGPNVQNCETSSLQTFRFSTASWDTSKVCFQIENQEHVSMWKFEGAKIQICLDVSQKTPFIKVLFYLGKKLSAACLLQGPRSMMINIQPWPSLFKWYEYVWIITFARQMTWHNHSDQLPVTELRFPDTNQDHRS